MAFSGNKKLSILYILETLKDYSDENHVLSQAEIVKKLYSIYGMECERKSVGANIDNLIDFGYDIIKTKSGCYLAGRDFEPSEIQFLVDAVFSSKSIDSKHSRELANKLSKSLSTYQRKQYKYVYKAEELNRTDNKQLFYNIDIINEAIENKKQIKFHYNRFYYNQEKNQKPYIVNPYFLINSQGKYFLVCNNDYFDDIANYKVDRIYDIEILETNAKPVIKVKGFEKGLDITKYANENIYMFGSTETIKATIKIYNTRAQAYVEEWFGKNARFYEKDGIVFADIEANESSLIYWCLQYGEVIELISPADCREKIKTIINEMEKRYK